MPQGERVIRSQHRNGADEGLRTPPTISPARESSVTPRSSLMHVVHWRSRSFIQCSHMRNHRFAFRLAVPSLLPGALIGSLLIGSATFAAESLAGSSAAGGSSASSAASSASDSASASSNSSTQLVTDAQGPYRVAMIAPVPGDERMLRVTLEQDHTSSTLHLRLPRAVAERAALANGAEVIATQRPYGVQFTRADRSEPFFLVIRDEVHREFAQTPVRL